MEYLVAILTGALSASVTLIVCVINNRTQARMAREQIAAQAATSREEGAKRMAIIELKIDQLSDRVDKHNNLIERTFKLEQQTAVQEEKLKVANHRIDDLEKR